MSQINEEEYFYSSSSNNSTIYNEKYSETASFKDYNKENELTNRTDSFRTIYDETTKAKSQATSDTEYKFDCHPILYFLLILYNSMDAYYKKKNIYQCLEQLLIERGLLSGEINFDVELLDINELLFRLMDTLPERLFNTAKIFTIKNCYLTNSKKIQKITIINSFIIYSLGSLIHSDKWYKFEYNKHGWKETSELEILQDINIFFATNLETLCRKAKLSLDGFTTYVSQFLCMNIIYSSDIVSLSSILYLNDFNQRIDKKPILRFNDCVYDFRMKSIRPGRPCDFCVKGTGYNYHSSENNKENTEMVMNFLKDLFVEEELITYVLKLLASTLTIGNKLRSLVFFIGSGRNGKTALVSLLKYTLGDYAAIPNVSLFLGRSISSDKPNPHMVELNNARIALCEEPDAKVETITGDAKAITGNVGYLKSRTLFKGLETIYVDLLPIINTNHKLTLTNIDSAIIDRIIVIPFLQRFEPSYAIDKEEKNVKVANTMWQGRNTERFAPSFVHILLKYYQEDYSELIPPAIVREHTRKFILRCDHIGRFIQQNLVDDNNDDLLKLEDVFNTYKRWYHTYVTTSLFKCTISEFKLDLLKYKIRLRTGNPQNKNSSPEDVYLQGYHFM
ncbi:hypothetical protein LY90DRAFT_700973 [Neocallimastix californiae]|jgi:P4 family phage/plasmid primase-like protien|uniref:SF3 helicase domain-containing protein n=1 Tax=Neocallimastix californiae TaxID=1754190 RepID=A0A1Y2DX09_9FUNG|nr:hypothetical protein LY90DRAFT_700973 [Neocallimastix californiae]|eukprot:ORY63634.1 hypothetical protein LY90DRAFT_700973 [Neocallimastix californiae]